MNIIITAPNGKMGRLLVREALKRKNDFNIVGAIGRSGAPYIGKDISVVSKTDFVNALIYDDINAIIDKCDGIIDFSTVHCSMNVLAAAVKHKKPLVIGTTGFNDDEEKVIFEASKSIALTESHNTSKAVNLLYDLIDKTNSVVGGVSDIDIIDLHDNKKLDAPSGTAKVINKILNGKGVHHSIRSGNISSSHQIIFGMDGERIELIHHAYDFSTFAKGALDCMLFLKDKPAGFYDSKTCLGLR